MSSPKFFSFVNENVRHQRDLWITYRGNAYDLILRQVRIYGGDSIQKEWPSPLPDALALSPVVRVLQVSRLCPLLLCARGLSSLLVGTKPTVNGLFLSDVLALNTFSMTFRPALCIGDLCRWLFVSDNRRRRRWTKNHDKTIMEIKTNRRGRGNEYGDRDKKTESQYSQRTNGGLFLQKWRCQNFFLIFYVLYFITILVT